MSDLVLENIKSFLQKDFLDMLKRNYTFLSSLYIKGSVAIVSELFKHSFFSKIHWKWGNPSLWMIQISLADIC